MTNDTPATDDTNVEEPTYFEIATLHTLHRIWELLATDLMLKATTDEDRQTIQSIISKQLEGDYATPMPW